MARPIKTIEEQRQIMDYVCRRMAKGMSWREAMKKKQPLQDGETKARLKNICSADYFFKLVREVTEFSEQYTRAHEAKNQIFLHEIIQIADTPLLMTEETQQVGDESSYTKTVVKDNLGRSKLKIDARQWYMMKTQPKVFGNQADAGQAEHVEQELFPDLHTDDDE